MTIWWRSDNCLTTGKCFCWSNWLQKKEKWQRVWQMNYRNNEAAHSCSKPKKNLWPQCSIQKKNTLATRVNQSKTNSFRTSAHIFNLLTGSNNQFWNYESSIFTRFLTKNNNKETKQPCKTCCNWSKYSWNLDLEFWNWFLDPVRKKFDTKLQINQIKDQEIAVCTITT